jgi:cytoskeletal protein CcmA (bactofilin family)
MPAGARADLTVIAAAGRVAGEVCGAGDVRVDGIVDGVIDCEGRVVVSEGGRVTASVRGVSITVAGTVEGNINAEERIQLDPTARVVGDLVAPRILIQDGATLQGAVEMKAPPNRATRPAATPNPSDTSADADSGDVAPEPAGHDAETDDSPSGTDDQPTENQSTPSSKPSDRRAKRRSRPS